MSFIHHEKKEIHFMVVYAGPPSSGKATSLRQIAASMVPDPVALAQGSVAHVPVSLGAIRGYSQTVHLLPLSTRYDAEERAKVLRAPDGIVFVADSTPGMFHANVEAYSALKEEMRTRGMDIAKFGFSLQANKQDVAGAVAPGAIASTLGVADRPFFGGSATMRTGVFEPLKEVCRQMLQELAKK